MALYIVRRILVSIPLLLGATAIVFVMVSLSGDPIGELRAIPNITQERIDAIAAARGLDQPIPVRYGIWLQELLTGGGFGEYNRSARPIWPELRTHIGRTLQLVIIAEVLSIVIALFLGVMSARRQYSIFDYSTTFVSFVGFSMPVFWFALILQTLATLQYNATGVRVFYTASMSSTGMSTADGWAFYVDRAQHLALPILTLMVISVAAYSRYMRASMLEVVNSDYIRTARAKGVKERTVTVRHAMRNALIPVLTVTALSFGTLLSGAIVTETVFGIPGMGAFFIENLNRRDAPALMAWLTVTSVVVVAFNLIADILYGVLDPRIRYD